MAKVPFRDIELAPVKVAVEEGPRGVRVLRSELPLGPYEANLGELLRRWAADAPERPFLAERDTGGGWRRVTYAEAAAHVEAIGQALLDRELGPERPLLILSGNSVDHALLALGGLLVGVPVVPVSVAYSQLSKDFGKLRAIAELVRPALVFAEQGEAFAAAIASLPGPPAEVIVSSAPPSGMAATELAALLATRPTVAVRQAAERVGPDSVAKVLFTSGSTGEPKGVVTTHRMLCANQQMLAQVWPFTAATPPVLVDWLPWSHTFGGSHNFNLVLKRGGTLHIDRGRPAPGLIEQTVGNLAEVSPTIYFNVPAGYGALLPYLERDAGLAASFFERLQLLFYAGAALPQDLWERLEALSARTIGRRVLMTSSWGTTETAPAATMAHFPLERAGNIGVPVPGVEVKLVPSDAKQELRVRGPNVTPGYLHRPDLTAAAFDEDGFYRTGDAGRLADPADPGTGLLFDGRIAEDFKLSSGTWVHTGKLRMAVLAAASPLLQDAVVAGADRDQVGLLVWLNLPEAGRLADPSTDDAAALARAPTVLDAIRTRLAGYNAGQPGSSARIGRVLVMTEPPSIDAGEITDKGYVNQRATLERRQALVERLFAEPLDADVLVL